MKVNRKPVPATSRSPGPAESSTRGPTAASPSATQARGWQARPGPRSAPSATSASRPNLAPTGTPPPVRGAFSSAGFQATLDAATNSRAVPGNRTTLLFDGVASFAERNRLIDGAKSSICLQTFIFTSDETGWDLARRLAAKAKEGVSVKVIYDAVGSGRADPKMFEMMRSAGVDVRAYGEKWKVWDLNDRWHEKHLLVDGNASIQGGMNIANEYAFGGSGRQVLSRGQQGAEAWRDADVKLEGPAVADAMKAFLRNWSELGGTVSTAERERLFPRLDPLPGGPSVRVVQANPEVGALDGTTHRLYLESIRTAQRSITIENAYFLPPKELRSALMDAARRGVDVRVMTNSRASNDMGFVSDAARAFYDDLIKAGVKIYEKQGSTLHSKTATFDGEFSIVGSVNLNGRSRNTDAEVAVAVQDASTAGQLEQRFSSGLSEARRITMGELGQESLVTNLKQWALSTLAWTF
jgi:cardiolipin synthase